MVATPNVRGPNKVRPVRNSRSAVKAAILAIVDAVVHLATGYSEPRIKRKIPDRQQILHLPQVAGVGQPVLVDTHFALFEARKAAGPTHRERAIARQVAVEIRACADRHPQHVTAQRHRQPNADLGALPIAVATQGFIALQVFERHGDSTGRIERRSRGCPARPGIACRHPYVCPRARASRQCPRSVSRSSYT